MKRCSSRSKGRSQRKGRKRKKTTNKQYFLLPHSWPRKSHFCLCACNSLAAHVRQPCCSPSVRYCTTANPQRLFGQREDDIAEASAAKRLGHARVSRCQRCRRVAAVPSERFRVNLLGGDGRCWCTKAQEEERGGKATLLCSAMQASNLATTFVTSSPSFTLALETQRIVER